MDGERPGGGQTCSGNYLSRRPDNQAAIATGHSCGRCCGAHQRCLVRMCDRGQVVKWRAWSCPEMPPFHVAYGTASGCRDGPLGDGRRAAKARPQRPLHRPSLLPSSSFQKKTETPSVSRSFPLPLSRPVLQHTRRHGPRPPLPLRLRRGRRLHRSRWHQEDHRLRVSGTRGWVAGWPGGAARAPARAAAAGPSGLWSTCIRTHAYMALLSPSLLLSRTLPLQIGRAHV